MKLSKILSAKSDENKVLSIVDTASLTAAAKLFCEHHVGSLLVKRNDEYIGIITERDIIKMCTYKSEFYHMQVTEIMTEDMVTCELDNDVDHVLKVMAKHNIRHIPVADEDVIVGVITIGDILKELYEEDEIVIHDIADLSGANSRNKVY